MALPAQKARRLETTLHYKFVHSLHGWNDEAMQYIQQQKNTNHWFNPKGGLKECGEPTWSFYRLPEVRQKPLHPGIMNKCNHFQGHGAHMTLAVFVQTGDRLRSPEK